MTTPDLRRAGNGSGKITREAVLAAALEIIDRDGADALSMRRLARVLDRDPMIIYRHAPVQRIRRPAHLPGPVRVRARPHPGRATGTRRKPRRNR
jgi:hypothetical protein